MRFQVRKMESGAHFLRRASAYHAWLRRCQNEWMGLTISSHARLGFFSAATAFLVPFIGITVFVNRELPDAVSVGVRIVIPLLAIAAATLMVPSVAHGGAYERPAAIIAVVAAASVLLGYVLSYLTRDDPANIGAAAPAVLGLPFLMLGSLVAWLTSGSEIGHPPAPVRKSTARLWILFSVAAGAFALALFSYRNGFWIVTVVMAVVGFYCAWLLGTFWKRTVAARKHE